MENITIQIADQEYTFAVAVERDDHQPEPWKEFDGHGIVSDWETRPKLPGELVLNEDRWSKRFYDFAASCKLALRDSWGSRNAVVGMTRRQVAALAAREDFERLRAWCNDEWEYVMITVTLLVDGEESDISMTVGGFESDDEDYLKEAAKNMADELASQHGTQWDYAVKRTAYWR